MLCSGGLTLGVDSCSGYDEGEPNIQDSYLNKEVMATLVNPEPSIPIRVVSISESQAYERLLFSYNENGYEWTPIDVYNNRIVIITNCGAYAWYYRRGVDNVWTFQSYDGGDTFDAVGDTPLLAYLRYDGFWDFEHVSLERETNAIAISSEFAIVGSPVGYFIGHLVLQENLTTRIWGLMPKCFRTEDDAYRYLLDDANNITVSKIELGNSCDSDLGHWVRDLQSMEDMDDVTIYPMGDLLVVAKCFAPDMDWHVMTKAFQIVWSISNFFEEGYYLSLEEVVTMYKQESLLIPCPSVDCPEYMKELGTLFPNLEFTFEDVTGDGQIYATYSTDETIFSITSHEPGMYYARLHTPDGNEDLESDSLTTIAEHYLAYFLS
jgi:hypothetical protein